jgi:DNA-damage-inducible protein J
MVEWDAIFSLVSDVSNEIQFEKVDTAEDTNMPRAAMIHARMEPELKQSVESIFKELGMSTTEAVTLFYKQVKMRRGLPFSVEVPDEELDNWQREEIRKGLEEMRTGKLVDHSDVVERWAARK